MSQSFAIPRAASSAPHLSPLHFVARKYKVGTLRQLADILSLKFAPNNLTTAEYYAHEVYRPDLTQAQKRAFIGILGSTKLNTALQGHVPPQRRLIPFADRAALQQHPEIAALTNSETPSQLRVVTLLLNGEPRILYALWAMPDPLYPLADGPVMAVTPNTAMIGELDPATGKLRSMRKGTGPDTQWPVCHPKTHANFMGATVPDWQSVRAIACAAHRMLSQYRILGWDLAVCHKGPRLIGGTANPRHGLYQLASARGVLNPAFKLLFEAIKAGR